MVMRTGCALPTKDYLTSWKWPSFAPIIASCWWCAAYLLGDYLNEIIAMKDRLGAPVEILSDLQHEEVAELMSRAGVYLHTNRPDSTFGMPISIAAAMATGSYIIGRRCPGALAYIQNAGQVYETVEEAAALIRQTEGWGDEQWRQTYVRSIDHAYRNFISTEVLAQMVADWRQMAFKEQK